MNGLNEFLNLMKGTLQEQGNISVTENGALGYRTTGKELLDMNFAVASMRNMEAEQIVNRFVKVFYEDRRLAVKWLFYACDVREGMGERRLFRILLHYLAENHCDIAKAVLMLVPEYSRWDNLWCLLDTALADDVVAIVEKQLEEDMRNCVENKPISLLAKWLPSVNASSVENRRLAHLLIKKLDMSNGEYRKLLAQLRAYMKVIEVTMSKGEWEEIVYEHVPSRANLLYKDAFLRHDKERREAYLESLKKGETTIHSQVLFPQDIVHQYYNGLGWGARLKTDVDDTLEELWKALPDYVQGDSKTLCVVDGSGSMTRLISNTGVNCLQVAQALAIYFSERCDSKLRDKYMTFSMRPQLVNLSRGRNLREKLEIASAYTEVANTNIEAVFDLLLVTAVNAQLKQEQMPENILILSDMEFDSCARVGGDARPDNRLFTQMTRKYSTYGYKLPRLVFWNIAGRTGTIPVKDNELGVALVSGFSPVIMKQVLSNSTDPFECLLEELNAERYDAVELAIADLVG